MSQPPKPVAIYTRKSSEEGLEQSFNSLDAQREACTAYIKSQAHEGWKLIKTAYDDGGYSGGSMDRPGLQRLLQDIKVGLVKVVVVYKVDRLTRSLMDFAKIIEILDGHGASFVSVTQNFNTTSSMGRLTLNVLLSFAQFERELTGERIRDKVAASRAKGIWMGGNPPLGYDVRDRKLVVNQAEAARVREIFTRYLKLGTVATLSVDLHDRGVVSKRWKSKKGITHGGVRFSRGALYALLQNRTYLGETVHKKKSYPGQHEPIVDPKIWARVQRTLEQNTHERGKSEKSETPALLAGVLFDDRGHAMSPTYTSKANGSRYRYYVSQAVLQHRSEVGSLRRVSAAVIDGFVSQQVIERMEELVKREFARAAQVDQARRIRAAIERVELGADEVTIKFAKGVGRKPAIVRIPIRLRARSRGTVIHGRPDKTLIKALARAWWWREMLVSGQAQTVEEIASRTKVTERYVRELLPLGFLAPAVARKILVDLRSAGLGQSEVLAVGAETSWLRQGHRLADSTRS